MSHHQSNLAVDMLPPAGHFVLGGAPTQERGGVEGTCTGWSRVVAICCPSPSGADVDGRSSPPREPPAPLLEQRAATAPTPTGCDVVPASPLVMLRARCSACPPPQRDPTVMRGRSTRSEMAARMTLLCLLPGRGLSLCTLHTPHTPPLSIQSLRVGGGAPSL